MSSRVAASDPQAFLSSLVGTPLPLLVTVAIPAIPILWTGQSQGLYMFLGSWLALVLGCNYFEKRLDFVFMAARSPIFIFATIYLICALSTANLGPWRQMLYKMTELVWCFYVPIVLFALAPRKPSEFMPALFAIVVCSLYWAIDTTAFAISTGFQPLEDAFLENGLHKNRVGQLSILGGLVSVAFLMTQKPKWWQIGICGAVMLTSFAACLGVDARACMLTIPISAIVLAVAQVEKNRDNWKKLVTALIGSVILVVGAVKFAPVEKVDRLSETEKGSSFAARPYFWGLAIDHLKKHPFQPVGFGNEVVDDNGKAFDNTCNLFLQQWSEVGLLGAIAYLGMILSSLIVNFRICARPTRSRELAFLAASCMCIQVLRFFFEMEDAMTIGVPAGMLLYACIGTTLFMSVGIRMQARADLEAYTAGSETKGSP